MLDYLLNMSFPALFAVVLFGLFCVLLLALIASDLITSKRYIAPELIVDSVTFEVRVKTIKDEPADPQTEMSESTATLLPLNVIPYSVMEARRKAKHRSSPQKQTLWK